MTKNSNADKTPEQAKEEAATAAIAAERVAKNKANAALDAYESVNTATGPYGELSARAIKLQELALAGRDVPLPTADEVAATQLAAAEATAAVDKQLSAK